MNWMRGREGHLGVGHMTKEYVRQARSQGPEGPLPFQLMLMMMKESGNVDGCLTNMSKIPENWNVEIETELGGGEEGDGSTAAP